MAELTLVGWVKFDGDEFHDFRYASPVDRKIAHQLGGAGYIAVYAKTEEVD